MYFEGTKNGVYVEVAFQHNDAYSESIFSFVNNISTPEGGTHLQGFRNAITKTFNDYARAGKLLKDNEQNLSGEDIREGLTAIISVKIEDPQFEGQTKQKLGNSEARGAVDGVVSEKLTEIVSDLNNTQMCNKIIEKAIATSKVREAAKKAKKIATICAVAVIVVIAAALVMTRIVIPNNQYNAAVELMDAGQYEDAIAAFEAMDGYKDSAEQIVACQTALQDLDYYNAVSLMENGAEVRSLEELQENFDLESVIGYFTDGKLQTWLADRYFDDKAEAVSQLSSDMSDLNEKLCEILEVGYSSADDETDIEVIQRRNEKLTVLRQAISDDALLEQVDIIALDQDDLYDILDTNPETVYLYGEKFSQRSHQKAQP